MSKNLLKLLTIFLAVSIFLGIFAGCSKNGDSNRVSMPSGLSTREKFEWGTERFPVKLISQLQTLPTSDPLGITSTGGTTETSIRLSGDDQLSDLDEARINTTSTYNPETKNTGIYYEFEDFLGEDFEFGVYLVDDYLYITSDSNLFDSFRLQIGENFNFGEQLVQAISAILEEISGASLSIDLDDLKSQIDAVYSKIVTDDCYFEEDGSISVLSETYETQRIIFRLDGEQIYQLTFEIINILQEAINKLPASDASSSSSTNNAGEGATSTDENIPSTSDTELNTQIGYYTDGYELYYFDGELWSYFDSSYNLWIGYSENIYDDISYLDSEFQTEFSSEFDAFEFMGYFGYYYSEGYYQDIYGDWYYLSGGNDGTQPGWYAYDYEWYFWRYTYIWEDVENYYPQYTSEIDVPEFEIAQEIYTEHGYYQDLYGYIYYHNPEDSDWYSYDEYSGWYYFTDAYFWDDLSFLSADYPRGSDFPPYGQDYLSTYREQGYYTDGLYYYYCDDYDGTWYYFVEPPIILLGNNSDYGWQYYAEYYSYEDLDYLGDSTDQIPEFNGIGSGTDGYLENQLKTITDGAEIEYTLDFYEDDLISFDFTMDFEITSCKVNSLLWNSGIESAFEFEFDVKNGGQQLSLDFNNNLERSEQADYAGDFRFYAVIGSDTFTVKGDTEINLDKNSAEVISDFDIDIDSTASGDGHYILTQSIGNNAVSSSEIDFELSIQAGSESGSASIRGTSETYPLDTDIDIIGWDDDDLTFENLEELFNYLLPIIDEISYY